MVRRFGNFEGSLNYPFGEGSNNANVCCFLRDFPCYTVLLEKIWTFKDIVQDGPVPVILMV